MSLCATVRACLYVCVRVCARAPAVTRGWNGYRNKSQHRKSTLEKKILPPLQQRFEPATFQSRVRRSNHWAIPAPVLPWVLQARRQAWAGSSTLRSLAVFGGAPFRSSLFTWVLPGGRQAWTGLVPLRAWPCLMPRSSVQVSFLQVLCLALSDAEVLSSGVASPSSLLPSASSPIECYVRLAWSCLMLRSSVQVSLLQVLRFLRDYQPDARRFGSNRVLRTARVYALVNTRWAAPKGRTEGRLILKKTLPS